MKLVYFPHQASEVKQATEKDVSNKVSKSSVASTSNEATEASEMDSNSGKESSDVMSVDANEASIIGLVYDTVTVQRWFSVCNIVFWSKVGETAAVMVQ